jgi:acyl carrier protein
MIDVDERIVPEVCQVIAKALGRPLDAVRPETRVVDDLGIDSLDVLDVVFSLEQAFGIEITRGALEDAARGDMSDDEFAPAGVISVAGLERLRALLPEAAEHITDGLRPREIVRLFTARTFARIVSAQRRQLQ